MLCTHQKVSGVKLTACMANVVFPTTARAGLRPAGGQYILLCRSRWSLCQPNNPRETSQYPSLDPAPHSWSSLFPLSPPPACHCKNVWVTSTCFCLPELLTSIDYCNSDNHMWVVCWPAICVRSTDRQLLPSGATRVLPWPVRLTRAEACSCPMV